jgi:hypothetical protein
MKKTKISKWTDAKIIDWAESIVEVESGAQALLIMPELIYRFRKLINQPVKDENATEK